MVKSSPSSTLPPWLSLRIPKREEYQVPDTAYAEILDEDERVLGVEEEVGEDDDDEGKERKLEGSLPLWAYGRFMYPNRDCGCEELSYPYSSSFPQLVEGSSELEGFMVPGMHMEAEERMIEDMSIKTARLGLWDHEVEEKRASLNLNLNYQEVLDAWSNSRRSPPWVAAASVMGVMISNSKSNYTGEVPVMEELDRAARREASVSRYKEKRQSRLFANKIRYQVRKINADNRPRIKGRFAKRNSGGGGPGG